MFGNGTRTNHGKTATNHATGERVKAVFDNAMCAHVWAQNVQTFGQSSNGNLFFEGRTLYSYGSHFAVGFLAPDPKTGQGVAASLVTADSYSNTTAGHIHDARRAVAGRLHLVPGLTLLARDFDTAASVAGRDESAWVERGRHVKTAWNAAAYRDFLAPRVRAHIVRESNRMTPDFAAFLLTLAGLSATKAASQARAALSEGHKAIDQERAEKARREVETRLRQAKAIAGIATPAALRALRIAHKESARMTRGSCAYETQAIVRQAKEAHRAARAAKAKGWTQIAAACRAYHKALHALIPLYTAAEQRRNRLAYWRGHARDVRAAIAALTATPENSGTAELMRRRAYALRTGDSDLSNLTAFLSDMEAARPRPYGLDLAAFRARAAALSARINSTLATVDRAQVQKERREFVRNAQAAADSSVPVEERVKAAKEAARFCYWYAPSKYRTTRPVPGVFRVAGWTPETFAAIETAANRIEKELSAELSAARAAAAKAAREEAERAAAAWVEEARAAWRAGQPGPARPAHIGYDAAGKATRCNQGGAMLRARGVERDAAGVITGGELETSQGASVPLPHAVRAFRFLKLCRETGKEWRTNGRTVRVGHFKIDRVTAAGDFVAGCHSIKWEEVESLALALGVFDLAPVDAREPA